MTGSLNKPVLGWSALSFAGFLALCGVVSGCCIPTIPKHYPAQLPALVPGVEETGIRGPASDRLPGPHPLEPEIAGRYSDKGDAMSPSGKELGRVSLTQILHWKDAHVAATATNVDSVEVIGPKHDRRHVFTRQPWQPENPRLERQRRFARPVRSSYQSSRRSCRSRLTDNVHWVNSVSWRLPPIA